MLRDTEEKITTSWMKEAQKGYIRIGVLILLNKRPAHGYELMKEIRERTKGFWTPTAGGVYPILRDLEKSGYIVGEWQTQKNRKLKVYKITESGNLILKRAIIKQTEISTNIGALFREFARDVLNIEASDSMPNLPSFFGSFLEEESGTKPSVKQLEQQKKHIQEAITKMQNELKNIDRKIAKAKKKNRKIK